MEKIKAEIKEPLLKENIEVDDIYFGEEDGQRTLFIVVNSDVVDLKMTVKATKIINPIIDKLDLIKEEYVLDVSGKVSGNNER